ncbi:hypothetical protein JVU11DRAFT_8849 [Chiua virens]|nr:hypothetical protein JVU11DRAFT_8849 [Chiua virens]
MLAYDSPLQDPHMATSANSTPVYDPYPRGRQKIFSESALQRRDRIEFLKQREWVRRVTEWINFPSLTLGLTAKFWPLRPILFPFSYYDTGASAVPFPCLEEEEEPYIIYSSSPSSSLSSLSEEITPVLPLSSGPSPSLSLPPAGVPQATQRRHHRRGSSASLRGHARKQSLSSIYEVPEED